MSANDEHDETGSTKLYPTSTTPTEVGATEAASPAAADTRSEETGAAAPPTEAAAPQPPEQPAPPAPPAEPAPPPPPAPPSPPAVPPPPKYPRSPRPPPAGDVHVGMGQRPTALFLLMLAIAIGGAPLQWLGRISYSIYLLHVLVGVTFLDMAGRRISFAGASSLTLWALLVAALALSLGAAWAFWKLVEAPSQKLARRLFATAVPVRIPTPLAQEAVHA